YWLIEGTLAGCSLPGRRGPGEGAASDVGTLDGDLAALRERGIGALLTLTEQALPAEALARHGLVALHLPVVDMQPPEPDELARALAFIDLQRAHGRAVAVHCLMGQGRTGTVLAAYLVRAGATGQQALEQVRAVCPGAVGTLGQERAVEAFARRRDWVL
ncbi:MAG: dual specificity protein phosphatase family protein, partial [Ktedonobacterales bacterium]